MPGLKSEKHSPPARRTISPSRCLSHATNPPAQSPITQARSLLQPGATIPRWRRPATQLKRRPATPQAGQNPATPTELLQNPYGTPSGLHWRNTRGVHRRYTGGTPEVHRIQAGSTPDHPHTFPPASRPARASSSASRGWWMAAAPFPSRPTPSSQASGWRTPPPARPPETPYSTLRG